MTKDDVRIAKKKILRCLTEDFTYGTTKTGKPLKRGRKQNQAIFNKQTGQQCFNGTDLEAVMEAVVTGLYFAMADSQEGIDDRHADSSL